MEDYTDNTIRFIRELAGNKSTAHFNPDKSWSIRINDLKNLKN